jgi:hypothetical protein
MGYELIWQPLKQTWAIYSTVVCNIVAEGLKTPEEVAEYIVGPHEYYYFESETQGKKIQARCEFTSREQIINDYKKWIEHATDSCWDVLTPTGWEHKCTPKEEVVKTLQAALKRDLERWDRGEIRPDPKAKEDLRKDWIEEAKKVRNEGRLIIDVTRCEITPRGFEIKGKDIIGPEKW